MKSRKSKKHHTRHDVIGINSNDLQVNPCENDLLQYPPVYVITSWGSISHLRWNAIFFLRLAGMEKPLIS
ncbi:MAG: hypothetical protein WBZ36_01395 [Candidatus Nitrosopolaris sp.]